MILSQINGSYSKNIRKILQCVFYFRTFLVIIIKFYHMRAINFKSSQFKLYEQIYQQALTVRQSSFIKQRIKSKIETKVILRYHEVFKPDYKEFISSEENQFDVLHNKINLQKPNEQIMNLMYSPIGLIYSKYAQNKKQIYIYSTGTLIHQNIVLTAAQNVYCRRSKQQYTNINFIPGMHQNHHDGIIKIKRVFYPDQYRNQQNYQQYDYAILELEKDIDWKYGCMGLHIEYKLDDEQKVFICGYQFNDQANFVLKQLSSQCKIKNNAYIEYDNMPNNRNLMGAPIIIQYSHDNYKIIGINTNDKYGLNLSIQIRNKINCWMMKSTSTLNLTQKNHKLKEICSFLQNKTIENLTEICLNRNDIGSQGCKYLQYTNWPSLKKLSLDQNHINQLGCLYIKNAKWPNLQVLNLNHNEIGYQGCYHLKDAQWYHLKQFRLINNNIQAEGCKHLKDAKWYNLNALNLMKNNINSEGCRYIVQSNWCSLILLALMQNNIGLQGIKYLKDGNWIYLEMLNLANNPINLTGKLILMKQGVKVAC